MKTTILLGHLIASLYDEAKKETKNRRMQSLLVGLALYDLKLRNVILRKRKNIANKSAAWPDGINQHILSL